MKIKKAIKEVEYVLKQLNRNKVKNYSCKGWSKYGKNRIYISSDGKNQGYIDLNEMTFWSNCEDYFLDMVIEKFIKYFNKNKETLLGDIKEVLIEIHEKDSNSDAIYTAEKRDGEIIITKSFWYNQKSEEEIDETILCKINLDDLSYDLKFSNKPWLIQYEIFNNMFYTEILSKLNLYKDKNSIRNLKW